jgi:hypothetical protein
MPDKTPSRAPAGPVSNRYLTISNRLQGQSLTGTPYYVGVVVPVRATTARRRTAPPTQPMDIPAAAPVDEEDLPWLR